MNNCCIQCPYCGKSVDVIQGMEMLAGNEWTTLIQGLPNSTIGVLLRYLELFKPVKQELRWSRRLSLTQELMPMMKAAQVKRNGITYAAPIPVWEAEMLKLAARPASVSLPLKSNGYLLTVLAARGEQNAAQLERTTEQQRQNRGSTGHFDKLRTGVDKGLQPVGQSILPVLSGVEGAPLIERAKQKEQERVQQEHNKPPEGWRGNI
jgi:hypothetical protein